MTQTRRSFVLSSAGLALTVYGAGAYGRGALEDGIAEAQAAGGPNNVVVSVWLPGGADGMSILVPTGDPRYASLRPTLAMAPDQGTPFTGDSRLRWSPDAAGLATLHGEGKVTVLPAVGYQNPNQSHFTSRHYWDAGELERGRAEGWLGRLLDRIGSTTNPLQGLSLGGSLSPMLDTASMPVATVSRPDQYALVSNNVAAPVIAPMILTLDAFGAPAQPPPDWATEQAVIAEASMAEVRTTLDPYRGKVPDTSAYGGSSNIFVQRLASIARLLGDGLPIRAVTLNGAGGWDTHAAQATTFGAGVRLVADGLLNFQRDLERRGLADRVVVHLWSEFGRRPHENGSQGTDHGAGNLSLLIGSRVSGAMIGEFPGLATAQLDGQGNLKATSDFRGVYCSILEGWFGVGADEVLIPGAAALPRYRLFLP